MSEFLTCFQQKCIGWNVFEGTECSIISYQVLYLQMSEVSKFEYVLMATQSWAQRLRSRPGKETDLSLNPILGN